MNALARLLSPTEPPACEGCRHVRASEYDGLYCGRRAGAPYPCEVERGSARVEAWLYDACGRHARFFEPRAMAPHERVPPDAARRARAAPRS